MSQSDGSAIPGILPEHTVFVTLTTMRHSWAQGRDPAQVRAALIAAHIPPDAPWEHWHEVVERAQYLGVSA